MAKKKNGEPITLGADGVPTNATLSEALAAPDLVSESETREAIQRQLDAPPRNGPALGAPPAVAARTLPDPNKPRAYYAVMGVGIADGRVHILSSHKSHRGARKWCLNNLGLTALVVRQTAIVRCRVVQGRLLHSIG